jgi:hypothetical protein
MELFDVEAIPTGAVTVRTVEAVSPSGVTVPGEKLHVAPAGRPEQLRATGAANPFSGMMRTLVRLACPRVTVTELLDTLIENAGVGRLMVYDAEATELDVYPVSTANAFTVCETPTVIGPEYTLDNVVGVVPSVVK